MPRKLLEQSVLFASVRKWAALASLIGVIVGGSTALFLKLLSLGRGVSLFPVSAAVGFFTGAPLVRYLTPDRTGFVGMDQGIAALHKRSGRPSVLMRRWPAWSAFS
jgi:hypothetical protein